MAQQAHQRATALLHRGHVLAAFDTVERALEAAPRSRLLRELEARILLDLGAVEAGSRHLEALVREDRDAGREGALREEALGLLAGARKRQGRLEEALALYREAHEHSGGHWSGVNVASICARLGRDEEARRVATAVREDAERGLASATDPTARGWLLGTLGEAALVLRDGDTARDAYALLRAVVSSTDAWEQLQSARRSAEVLIESLALDAAWLAPLGRPPPVAVCTGHRIDAPERRTPRLPASMTGAVEAALDEVLARYDVRIGASALANGADILFQRALAARHAARHVVLPFDAVDFRRRSVADPRSAWWETQFDDLLEGADDVREAALHAFPESGLAFTFGNAVLYGHALLIADRIGADVLRVAVHDGRPAEGRGGTGGLVARWEATAEDGPLDVIRPSALPGWPGDPDRGDVGADAPPPDPGAPEDRVMAMLFADAKGFSAFDEERNLAFVRELLGAVRELVDAGYADDVFQLNTWGDGLFFVFDDVERAGRFALDLRDLTTVHHERLAAHGLETVQFRIALHAGPVRIVENPLTRAREVTGTHLSRAARTEPRTPVGQVYASEPFAALSRAHVRDGETKTRGARGYACRYVGRIDLAKGFGTFPTYVVERA